MPENKMASDKDLAGPLKEEDESDGTASEDSSEKDAGSDEKVDDENSIISSASKQKEEEEKKKARKAKKDKSKKKSKKKKDKKDKKEKEKEKEKEKDKKKKKLPPVVAPDYVHVEDIRSHHSRVSAITIPRPLQKIAKNHSGPPPEDYDYPIEQMAQITLPKNLTIGGENLVDDSQRSGRISLLSIPHDDSQRSMRISTFSQNPDTSLLDG